MDIQSGQCRSREYTTHVEQQHSNRNETMTTNEIINAAINTTPFNSVIGSEIAQYFYLVDGMMVIATYDRRSTRTTYEVQTIPRSLC